MKFFITIASVGVLNLFPAISHAGGETKDDAAILHRAEKVLTDIIVHDIFSPPVASRIYVYANIAAYEVLAKSGDHEHSLRNLRDLPEIQGPNQRISFPLASVYAFLLTGKKFVFSEAAMEDSIKAILKSFSKERIPNVVHKASLAYGKQVSDLIINWALKDNYNETRKLKRYQLLKAEGKWVPTPPGYMAAVEPYWNKIRTLILDSAAQFTPSVVEAFSKEKNSGFYQQAHEVYEFGKNLSQEQRDIANFWDCNPFFINTEGHLTFATKKISPGGHWISITGILCQQKGMGLLMSSTIYTCVSIAIFDAFISCWDEKYRSNLVRPETYINANIDESWRPLLQTPPFPEYPSGHSVVSIASAFVLMRFFGDMPFTDNSEVEFGLPARKFDSVMQAAKEAAISRLYGGIHYRAAIENGSIQGEKIGTFVMSRIF